jgi:hypothetical protein
MMRDKPMTIDQRLHRIVASQPYPLLFVTISRRRSEAMAGQGGAHVLSLDAVVGPAVRDETMEQSV